jgi:hypothetical protein
MIPYEELSAALERYRARIHGEAPPAATAQAIHSAPPPGFDDPRTAETAMPQTHVALGADDESTQVGEPLGAPPTPISDEHSNELDLGDVLSDEEVH